MAEPSQSVLTRLRRSGPAVRTAVEKQEWLDRPSYRLEHFMTFVFAAMGRRRDQVANALHGTWLGHPLHPALTAVPIGAATTTIAMDAIGLMARRAPEWRVAARFALGVGLVGSVGAAATGMTDWQHTQERSRRLGLAHGALNAVATGLYALSWRDRGLGRQARAVAASALGYGITLGSGYLGGAMVYGWGTGVDRSGTRLRRSHWTPVLPIADLDGQPRRVQVEGVGMVLYRNDSQVLATGENCPHLGAPMDDGWIDRDRIVCPWHGSRFSCQSGAVMRGPATADLPTYPTRIRHGMVEVRGVTR